MRISPAISPSPAPCARVQRALRRDDGQALVEFALILPLILLVIVGILDFGRAYNYKNDLTSLANQAARYAEVNSCSACTTAGQTIPNYVKSTADSNELINGGGQITVPVAITFCLPNHTSAVGDPLQVTATTTYQWLPYLHAIGLGATTTMRSSVTVRLATAWSAGLYTPASSC